MGLQVPFAPYLLVFFSVTIYLERFRPIKLIKQNKQNRKKKALYLSVNVFSMKVLTGDTIFYVSLWRQDCHYM